MASVESRPGSIMIAFAAMLGCKRTTIFPLEEHCENSLDVCLHRRRRFGGGNNSEPYDSMSGAKQWLAAMDTDHDGTVSKQEFTAYMEAQFDKADADHEGTLDEKELGQLRTNLELAKKP
jgi:hypothetical protein